MSVFEKMMGDSIRSSRINNMTYVNQQQFKDDYSYFEFTKNGITNQKYDGHFYKGRSYKRDLDVRTLVMYPNQTLSLGEYIDWKLGRYLVTGVDKRDDYQIKGEIMECNETLRWRDINDVLHEINCVFEIREKQTLTDYRKIKQTENENVIMIQNTDAVNALEINTRFILGKKAYRLYTWDKSTDDNLISLYVIDAQINEENDDLVNGIAYNEFVEKPTNDSTNTSNGFDWGDI